LIALGVRFGSFDEDGIGKSMVKDSRLKGLRVLVIGASSGVGRAAGEALAGEGARVAFAARRKDRLEEAVRGVLADGRGEALAIECDVCDESSVDAAVSRTIAAFGGLDALVYAPGIAVFRRLSEIDAETWRRVLDTNLVGPTLALRAAISHLEESRGKAVLISSIVIDDRPPRPQNAPYVVSKVALEALVQAWQGEHRSVGFTTIAMGDTVTEFGQDSDPALLGGMVKSWVQSGYMYGRAMDVESVAEQIVSVLRSRETIRRVAITPRYSDDPSDGGGHWKG
jgi:NAD(P)-dependent dehydrogenase (short-subunit alcohol dehydrogenase family)